MSDGVNLPEVADDEQLARFVVFDRWIRRVDNTVRPDAFIPPKNLQLSVTRHIHLSEADLWELGEQVTHARPDKPTLHGRADLAVRSVKAQRLTVEPTPTPRNHANICGWPADKPSQKAVAQQLAAAASYVPRPPQPA